MEPVRFVGLTNSINTWRQHNPNKWLPLLLQFGSCCSAFDANVDEDTAKLRKEAFIAAFQELAREAGVNPMDEPRERTEEPPTPDLTIVNPADVDRSLYCCSMRRGDTLEQPLFLPDSSSGVSWKQALVSVFRIGGVPGGESPYRQEVALLVLANAFGRPLGAWQVALPEPPIKRPHRLKAFSANPTSRREMRFQVLRFLGTDNLLDGFHLPWLLTALKLPLAASMVVELGSEPAFQLLCK